MLLEFTPMPSPFPPILRTLPLSGRQGVWGGKAESCWRPDHSRGLFEDSATWQGFRMCLSSTCAMAAAFLKPGCLGGAGQPDDRYLALVERFSDTTNSQAQMAAVEHLWISRPPSVAMEVPSNSLPSCALSAPFLWARSATDPSPPLTGVATAGAWRWAGFRGFKHMFQICIIRHFGPTSNSC